MPSIADSVVEMVQWVFPEHAGAPGQIHGGRMMQWITEAGTLAAGRVARGQVVLGATDDIDFLHPVRVGQIAILKAQVEYVGTSSLEVGVRVWAEDVQTGAREVTLNSHLVFVKMGEDMRPRPVPVKIAPADAAEARLAEAARRRRAERLARFAQKAARLSDTTAQPDGEVRHACTAFLTFVHLGPDLRPRRCPPFTPETPGERRRWSEAVARRELRLERVKRLKAALSNERG